MKNRKTSKTKAGGTRVKAKPAKTKAAKRAPRRPTPGPSANNGWNFRLYVAGQTPRSLAAFSNLKRLCELHLEGRYHIDIVDLVKEPHRAQNDRVVAIPTLVRNLPEPIKRVIGDLSNLDRVRLDLDLRPITA